MQQAGLLEVKLPRLKHCPRLDAASWASYAEWLGEVEAIAGRVELLEFGTPSVVYWYSGWSARQWVDHVMRRK